MRPTYRQYEQRKLGGKKSEWAGIVYMVRQSFTAPTFRQFWQRWNPLFSYYLLFFVYRRFNQFLPDGLASVLTFVFSGVIHDLAASAVLGRPFFRFSVTFGLYGIWTVLESRLNVSLLGHPNWVKCTYHLSLLIFLYLVSGF